MIKIEPLTIVFLEGKYVAFHLEACDVPKSLEDNSLIYGKGGSPNEAHRALLVKLESLEGILDNDRR